jgi:predicted Na+-dependent transporter
VTETLELVTRLAMGVFIVGSVTAVGLALTIARIVEPLRDVRLVVALLVANFVAVPAAAIAAGRVLPMDPSVAAAVVLIGCAAGAPFLPKLARGVGPDGA